KISCSQIFAVRAPVIPFTTKWRLHANNAVADYRNHPSAIPQLLAVSPIQIRRLILLHGSMDNVVCDRHLQRVAEAATHAEEVRIRQTYPLTYDSQRVLMTCIQIIIGYLSNCGRREFKLPSTGAGVTAATNQVA